MFAMREIAVSLTFFVLLYSCLSALVAVSWRWLRWLHATEQSLTDLLFLVRVLPLAASILFTIAFVVPSFQLLEPRATDEGMGRLPIALGIAALLLIAVGSWRVITAQRHTSRIVSRWLQGAEPLETGSPAVAFRSRCEAPPLTLVGMRKPRVLISDSTLALLNPEELHIALQHELAHIRSFDNFKKLLFRFAPFPGMAELEGAWSQAAELAADDAAVRSMNDAVDLAAALVKLSRLVKPRAAAEEIPVCTVGFVTGSISARVTRLLAWDKASSRRYRIPRWLALPPVLIAVFSAFLAYGPLLSITHELTEWLVR
jgi:hypothetical protein